MTPETLVENIDRLVSFPDVCIKVNRMVESPNYSASQMAKILSQDVDISARLLRLVNSALFGLQSKVDTISRAVAVAGSDEVRSLVMATTAVRSFTGIPAELVNMEDFWRQSIMTGVMSQLLAEHTRTLHSERLFVMGMLHDVGRLVINLTQPEKAREVLLVTGGDDWVSAEAENESLGFNHMDVGAALMRAWGMPDGLEMVAGYHHRPAEAPEYRRDVSLVHIAWAVARGELAGFSVEEMMWAIDPTAWEETGLSAQAVTLFVEEMLTKSTETIDLILSPVSRIVSK
ncbi:MAG: HDOD domain-containing protein [Candidatus Thiodiazotropha sp. (ex Monitilora ramsayi)]|nr:HDOD domain-containing protein [Candidatus Thiodiazotropha sp. (ex Monitilora ramsayi)]